ncbi:NUDIX domain-containing protein [Fontisphaera persica]|uniref:NUDIX hydrolase n=1 Tax=Fontisphaera persica TaxID=2974023 RepID=UPI0024BF8EF5|nr:NUDIX domain-containing protein [Fontisphaera persica]WCJ58969.1 NUDIX domain-containing protein [Fontisphaera persica]
MPDEMFDVVNEQDEVVGQAPRREVHARRWRHRAVHVLVFNRRGEIFLQKRSLRKDNHPGVWDSSASGHLDAGEDYDHAAVREAEEEIGLRLSSPPARLFKVSACPETGMEFVWVYRCEAEGPFSLNSEEIDEGRWFAAEAVDRWLAEAPQEFAPTFPLIWREWRRRTGAG